MMKKIIIIFILGFLYNFANISHLLAFNQEENNKLYKNCMKILTERYPSNISESEKWKNISSAISGAVEIIKFDPKSLEAMCVINAINDCHNWSNDCYFETMYKNWHNKFLDKNEDVENDLPEKIIFLTTAKVAEGAFIKSDYILQSNTTKIFNYLRKIKDECSNKDFAALALWSLVGSNSDKKYHIEFLDKFPRNPANIFVKLDLIFSEGSIDDQIEKINLLSKKYGQSKLPDGWNFETECNYAIGFLYAYKKDFESAKHYLSLVKEKAPNYYMIKDLQSIIETGNSNPFSEK